MPIIPDRGRTDPALPVRSGALEEARSASGWAYPFQASRYSFQCGASLADSVSRTRAISAS